MPLVRRKQFVLSAVAVSLACLMATPADALPLARWGISAGVIDYSRQQEAFELGLEVRFQPLFWGLVPHGGFHATVDESYYGYVGLRRPFSLVKERWVLEPSFAISLYERGEGKELGGPIEFRSGLDVLFQVGGAGWFGLGLYHLSNSSIYDLNPGTNSLLLRWILPGKAKRRMNDGR